MPGPELGAKALGLLAHVVDEFRALNAVGEAGEILDQSGDGELPAGLMAINDQRAEIGASGVDSGSQPRASGADDDDIANIVGHRSRNRFPEMPEDAAAPRPESRKTTNGRVAMS